MFGPWGGPIGHRAIELEGLILFLFSEKTFIYVQSLLYVRS